MTEVETSRQQLSESRARINNANDALEEALEAYLLTSKAAEVGVVSLDDLLASELRLTRVEINLINSRYALCQAWVQLDFALGEFSAANAN